MKYIVIFKETPSRWHIKSDFFDSLHEAEVYCDGVAADRQPMILPVVNMQHCAGFNSTSHGDMASLVEDIRQLFMFSYEEAGCDPMAEQLVLQSTAYLDLAARALRMAELCQTRAIANRSLT